VGITKTFTRNVDACQIAIVGGYRVDGIENGVYEMICRSGSFSRTVTDGFVVLIPAELANGELDRRITQARLNGWAHQHVTRCTK